MALFEKKITISYGGWIDRLLKKQKIKRIQKHAIKKLREKEKKGDQYVSGFDKDLKSAINTEEEQKVNKIYPPIRG